MNEDMVFRQMLSHFCHYKCIMSLHACYNNHSSFTVLPQSIRSMRMMISLQDTHLLMHILIMKCLQ